MKTYITVLISLIFVACGSYTSDGTVNYREPTSTELALFDKVKQLYQKTQYNIVGIDEIGLGFATSAEIERISGAKASGFATLPRIYLLDNPMIDQCWVMVHELMHISMYYLTGDSDQAHANSEAFNVFPGELCGELK